jgi:hypothetical protein
MDSSLQKKLIVMFTLIAILLAIGFIRYRDKIFAVDSSVPDNNASAAAAMDGNVPLTFDAWRSPIPEIRWQKPETVKLLKRDPMALDLSTVKIKIPKPRVRTPDNVKDSGAIGSITLGGSVYHVRGIVFSKDKDRKSSIIIEDKVLNEGDEIFGAVITKIFEHSVEFEQDGERWIVEIGEPSQKSDTIQK